MNWVEDPDSAGGCEVALRKEIGLSKMRRAVKLSRKALQVARRWLSACPSRRAAAGTLGSPCAEQASAKASANSRGKFNAFHVRLGRVREQPRQALLPRASEARVQRSGADIDLAQRVAVLPNPQDGSALSHSECPRAGRRTSAHSVRCDPQREADSSTPSHSGRTFLRKDSSAKRERQSSTAFVRSRHCRSEGPSATASMCQSSSRWTHVCRGKLSQR